MIETEYMKAMEIPDHWPRLSAGGFSSAVCDWSVPDAQGLGRISDTSVKGGS